jgi:NAD(P)-dependent dehydrogenase (short-subunit alcohol dehydrogenase family)
MTDIDRIMRVAPNVRGLFDLSGKVALVVGGTRGLGQAMALALGGAGADICVIGRGPAGLQETVEAVESLGRRGLAIAADVTVESKVQEAQRKIEGEFGRVDILVNSQGTVYLDPIESFDTDKWDYVMNVNLRSVFLCCKHFGGVMLRQAKGKIINISSVRGFQGRAKDPAYAPSKGAVNQLTRSLAIEWGPRGVNVNGIAPVFTVTSVSEEFLSNTANRDWVLGRIPLKRLGQLVDLMGPVLFLASGASDFVNGHILPVDGGWLSA